ncbi:uncharacterized protein LOC143264782 [Megachile rotundata]|uniref:uncharacterized protein LOC143264782 n=1 Tax=Megachile rotundata TaxID=143995 RepID=UPI003FD1EF39
MSVFVKCDEPSNKPRSKRMIECCGGCPPAELQCPQICTMPCMQEIVCYPCEYQEQPECPPPMPVTCMPRPPRAPCVPCAPRPFVCPPCTGHPCITCAPLPKPVPAPVEYGPVLRTPLTTGGLFYIGSTRCYTCTPSACC